MMTFKVSAAHDTDEKYVHCPVDTGSLFSEYVSLLCEKAKTFLFLSCHLTFPNFLTGDIV